MAQLSDSIEQFIKELMCEEAHIELRRNELAQHFGCAPSQINYVLATRFSVDHGYIIESRRGGGGYVRIVRTHQRAEGNLLEELLRTKKLPLARLAAGSGTERKTLERHRKYVLAMLLIQTNGYEIIRGHLKRVLNRKGGMAG